MIKKSYLFIIVAASLWGCIGVFLKILTAVGFTPMQAVALRVIVAAVIYVLFLLITDRKALHIRPRHCLYFVGTGICSLVFFNWCYFNAITHSSMAVAAVLLYTAPIFVMLMSAALFQEKITTKKLFALVITFLGCMLVTGLFPLEAKGISLTTLLFGLGSGFGYALYSIFGKFALRDYSSSTVTAYTFLFASLGALPIARLDTVPTLLLRWDTAIGCLGIGVLCCILPYLLYTEGLAHAEPSKASILATVEPLVATLLGILAYHESVTMYKVLGMAAILSAIVLLNWKEKVLTAA